MAHFERFFRLRSNRKRVETKEKPQTQLPQLHLSSYPRSAVSEAISQEIEQSEHPHQILYSTSELLRTGQLTGEQAVGRVLGVVAQLKDIGIFSDDFSEHLQETKSDKLQRPETDGEFNPMLCIRHSFQEYGKQRNFSYFLGLVDDYLHQDDFLSLVFSEEDKIQVYNHYPRWEHVEQEVISRVQRIWDGGLSEADIVTGVAHVQSELGKEADPEKGRRIIERIFESVADDESLVGVYTTRQKTDAGTIPADRSLGAVVYRDVDGSFHMKRTKGDTLEEINITKLMQTNPDLIREPLTELTIWSEMRSIEQRVSGHLSYHEKELELLPDDIRTPLEKLLGTGESPERIMDVFRQIVTLPTQMWDSGTRAFYDFRQKLERSDSSLLLFHLAACDGQSEDAQTTFKSYYTLYKQIQEERGMSMRSQRTLYTDEHTSLADRQFTDIITQPYMSSPPVIERQQREHGESKQQYASFAEVARSVQTRASEMAAFLARWRGENAAEVQDFRLRGGITLDIAAIVRDQDPELYHQLERLQTFRLSGNPDKSIYEEFMHSLQNNFRYGKLNKESALEIFNRVLLDHFVSLSPREAYEEFFYDNFRTYSSTPNGKREMRFRDERLRDTLLLMGLAQIDSQNKAQDLSAIASEMYVDRRRQAAASAKQVRDAVRDERNMKKFSEEYGVPESSIQRLLEITSDPRGVEGYNYHIYNVLFDIVFMTRRGVMDYKSPVVKEVLTALYPDIEERVWDEFQQADLLPEMELVVRKHPKADVAPTADAPRKRRRWPRNRR